MAKFFQHLNPVCGQDFDYVVQARVRDEDQPDDEPAYEQLLCKKVAGGLLQVRCIPMFIYDVALDDIIEDIEYGVIRRVKPSGRYVFRIFFFDQSYVGPILRHAFDMGCQIEPYSEALYALDCVDKAAAEKVSGFLLANEGEHSFEYETGLMSDSVV